MVQNANPRPSVESISELASRVLDGDIILPKFQRELVWKPNQALKLLESISRNYPIGSILLWLSKQHLKSERDIAGLEIAERPTEYPVNYLLDGQQRLSTICGSYYWDPKDSKTGDSLWNIVYDLNKKVFLHTSEIDPPMSQMPLRLMSDPAAYFQRVATLSDDATAASANDLFRRFTEYKVAAVTLSDMPIKSIAPIFERINSTGTLLTIVDLMRAATWTEDFDLVDEMDGIRDVLSDKNYGSVDDKAILRILASAAGYGFTVEDIDKLRNDSKDQLEELIVTTMDACARAVDFLVNHIGATYPSAIPYRNQFVVLADLFRQMPNASPEHFKSVERWFWKTTLTSYFSGWNTGQMARDVEKNIKFAKSGDFGEIDFDGLEPKSEVWAIKQFRANSAHAKMLALMMARSNPVDILTGERLDLSKSLSWQEAREYHHFFPKAFLRRAKVDKSKANAVANFILLSSASNKEISDRDPQDYLKKIIDECGRDELLRRLKSVIVPEAALDAALAGDFSRFVSERSKSIQLKASALSHGGSGTG